MPPVDHIKQYEVDPYTLQVLPGAEDRYDEDGNFKSWWARIPEMKEEKLKTGYEPIIAKKQKQQEKLITIADVEEQEPDIRSVENDSKPITSQNAMRKASMPQLPKAKIGDDMIVSD